MTKKNSGSMRPLKIGVDSYALPPLGFDAFSLLDWVKENGGEGAQFAEVRVKNGLRYLRGLVGRGGE